MAKRLHAIVTGRVQGVSFRACTQREALRLGLAGWVRNLNDGRVEFMAEGEASALQALLTFARRGPPAAQVDAVAEQWTVAAAEYTGFAIQSDHAKTNS